MSHLRPHRSVRILPGGGAAPVAPAVDGEPVEHDDSWDGLIASMAEALELGETTDLFASKVDETVEAFAHRAGVDLEVARTRIRGALLGHLTMVSDVSTVTDERVQEFLAAESFEDQPGAEILARLAFLHEELVDAPPTGDADDTVGEGPAGSDGPLPATEPPDVDVLVGQVAYRLDAVPEQARAAVAWIQDGDSEDDRRARAQAAQEVETERAEQRPTVVAAIEAVLGG